MRGPVARSPPAFQNPSSPSGRGTPVDTDPPAWRRGSEPLHQLFAPQTCVPQFSEGDGGKGRPLERQSNRRSHGHYPKRLFSQKMAMQKVNTARSRHAESVHPFFAILKLLDRILFVEVTIATMRNPRPRFRASP